MTSFGEAEHWFAVLRETRRQVKHIADDTGVESPDEGQIQDFRSPNKEEDTWQVAHKLQKIDVDGVWQEQQWQNAFEVLFLDTPEALKGGSQQDDLLFFVPLEHTKAGKSPLIVRRKGKAMPVDLCVGGTNSNHVSWVDSLLLNLVLQTAFRLTAFVRGRDERVAALEAFDAGLPPRDRRVEGDVYASPYRVQVHGPNRHPGGEAMVVAYPDICFAVDDSHTGFDQLVLPEAGSSLHVRLVAHQGIGLHAQPKSATTRQTSREGAREQGQADDVGFVEPVDLLSAFVSYEQLAEALSKHEGELKRKGNSLTISMRGPGGLSQTFVSTKWLRHSDTGHLLAADQTPAKSVPEVGGTLSRLKDTLLKRFPGKQETGNTDLRICCSMTEVNLPVRLLACMILGVPLKATAED